jgi:hypothetical protein
MITEPKLRGWVEVNQAGGEKKMLNGGRTEHMKVQMSERTRERIKCFSCIYLP